MAFRANLCYWQVANLIYQKDLDTVCRLMAGPKFGRCSPTGKEVSGFRNSFPNIQTSEERTVSDFQCFTEIPGNTCVSWNVCEVLYLE